jgi:hypothetical protein
MADDIIAAGENQLETAITKANQTLLGAFGELIPLSGPSSYRFLDQKQLKDIYRTDAENVSVVIDNFLEVARSIKKMQSSYLPIEFFKDVSGSFEQSIADNVSDVESYENTFMRMLGMPSASITRLREANDLIYVTDGGEVVTEASYEEVEKEILDQRQKKRCDRAVNINNSIYNINNIDLSVAETIAEGETELFLGAIATEAASSIEEEERASVEARITNISDDVFKFSYLLLPAIQDYRISECINEPEKLVASPFSAVNGRIINGKKIRPTLLESIIRIRLDRLSGTSTFFNEDVEAAEDSGGTGFSLEVGNEEVVINANSYGMLESLFILRLHAAIGGLGQKLADDIDDFIEVASRVSQVPDPRVCIDDDGGSSTKVEDAVDIETVNLNQQLLIEDAILSLLGDNSEALDLQVQTQRSSSIYDSHLMSGILGVVDIPRRRLQHAISTRERERTDEGGTDGEEKEIGINASLGVATGVGTVDVAVFCLALFSMTEESLLGLLSETDYQNLLTQDYKDLPASSLQRADTIYAINEFTGLVIAGYKEFQNAILDQDQESF